MRRIGGTILVLICLCLNSRAAEESAGFAGTWKLDNKKSDPFPQPLLNLGTPVSAETPGGMRGGGPGGGMPGGGGRGGFGAAGMPGAMPGGGRGMTPGAGRGGGGIMGFQNPATLTIQQSGDEIQIASTTHGMDGRETKITEHRKLDGQESVEMLAVPNSADQIKTTTKATLKKNKFQIVQKTFFPQGTNEVKREYSLQNDGKTLKIDISTNRVTFQTVQKLIYDKQE